MANTVYLLNFANTFGDWVTQTNLLARENNDFAANNYSKPTGTLFLNSPTLGLQVGANAVVSGILTVGSESITTTLAVSGLVTLTNATYSLVTIGQANIGGLLLAKASGTGLQVSNNATVGGTLTVTGNTTLGNVTAGNTNLGNVGVTGAGTFGGSVNVGTVIHILSTTSVGNSLNVQANAVIGNLIVLGTLSAPGFTGGGGGSGNGSSNLGNVTIGTWSANTIRSPFGGTGQNTYTAGQILIGNTVSGGLDKAIPSNGNNITITTGNGSLTIAAVGGTEMIFIPAAAMMSNANSGATWTQGQNANLTFRMYQFANSATQGVQFYMGAPKRWNMSTVTAKFIWMPSRATSNTVVWGIRGVAMKSGDAFDPVMGSNVCVANTTSGSQTIRITNPTPGLTIAGTPQADDLVVFEIFRAGANSADTEAASVNLFGVNLYFTTNRLTDD